MPDGSVYIEAEGHEKNVTEFINWCMKGPDSAYIEYINVDDAGLKNFKFFDVRF